MRACGARLGDSSLVLKWGSNEGEDQGEEREEPESNTGRLQDDVNAVQQESLEPTNTMRHDRLVGACEKGLITAEERTKASCSGGCSLSHLHYAEEEEKEWDGVPAQLVLALSVMAMEEEELAEYLESETRPEQVVYSEILQEVLQWSVVSFISIRIIWIFAVHNGSTSGLAPATTAGPWLLPP